MELARCFHTARKESRFDAIRAVWKAYEPRAKMTRTAEHHVYDLFGAYEPVPLAVAQHLGAFLGIPEPRVTECWRRAKNQRDLEVMEGRRHESMTSPDLSWHDLPVPALWLEDLLCGQVHAAQEFPYDLLGVCKPALSDVFVDQDILPRSVDSNAHPLRSRGPVSTLAEALASHEHLFITGNAGAGKTTVAQHLVHQLAQWWLRQNDLDTPWCPEVVVPIRISAADLRSGRSWYQRLSNAAVRAGGVLGTVDPAIFGTKPHGARWLINVDGLDEIASPIERREILRTLAQVMKQNHTCRLVITSRPLVQDELSPFADVPGVGFYGLRGFDAARQRQFAIRWFAAQGHHDPVRHAEGFLSDVGAAGLEEVLHTPLLTTVAAIIYDRSPGQPLPRGRIALYEAFLRELRHARDGAVDALVGFEQRWAKRGLAEVASWLRTEQERLLVELAWTHIRSEISQPLLVRATQWIRCHLPAGSQWPDHAESELGHYLALTGVLVFDGTELGFLHRSFAEFIAAQDEAAAIPSDFPGLGGWADAIANAAERNRLLFTFALWARREGNDVAVIVRHLLDGDSHHRLMALRLVTSGVALGQTLEASVIDRLTDFGDASSRRLFAPSADEISAETLRELSLVRGNKPLLARLRTIASTRGVATTTRIGAASACAQLESVQTGIELITAIAGSTHAGVLLKCYDALVELAPDDTDMLSKILRRALDDPAAASWERLSAAECLADLGYEDDLVEIAQTILAGPHQNRHLLQSAGRLWLELAPDSAPEALLAAVGRREWTDLWAALAFAAVLIEAGKVDEAIPYATVLFNRSIDDDGMAELTRIWVDKSGHAGADAIVAILADHFPWNSDARPRIARVLRERGFTDQALGLARMALADDRVDVDTQASWAIEVLVDVLGAESGEEVLQWIETAGVGLTDQLRIMTKLAHRGASADVLQRIARDVLQHPGASTDEFTDAADALVRSVGRSAWSEILDAMRARPFGGMALRVALLPVLSAHQYAGPVVDIVGEVLVDPGVTVTEIHEAVRAVQKTQNNEAAAAVAIQAVRKVTLGAKQLEELAANLSADGLNVPAVILRCLILEQPAASVETRWRALQVLIEVGAQDEAENALLRALTRTSTAQEQTTVERLLAWVRVLAADDRRSGHI
ncbi:NACHT domain-containing protein [Nocardia salmonicida]|uniref:NACHT domain-containing protein n=1 Tax=Nocardia salmonicida TaxID=53431 RepID=UPI0007A4E052|nr:hypothetical protein [Nocardia salmonicida]